MDPQPVLNRWINSRWFKVKSTDVLGSNVGSDTAEREYFLKSDSARMKHFSRCVSAGTEQFLNHDLAGMEQILWHDSVGMEESYPGTS